MPKLDIPRTLFASTKSNKLALLVTAVVIVTMISDVALARVYDLIAKQPTSIWRMITFIVITSICVIGQYFILGFTEQKTTHIRSGGRHQFRAIRKAARISQSALTAILVVLILELTLTIHYFTLLIIIVLWISHVLAIIMLGLLAYRFFSWSISNKSIVILLYAFASASLALNAGFTLTYVNDILIDRPVQMGPYSAGSMVLITPGSVTAALNSGFFISSIVSFTLLWGATAVLLSHYSLKLGRARYWITMASPLVLFISQFAFFYFRLFDQLMGEDPVFFTMWITVIFTLSKPAGGILFGIAFYTIAKNFGQNIVLRNYLIISAFGFVLLYVANQASVLLVAPFPPFGVISVSFVGLASYLILLGIYSSVISISEDVRLRQLVRKTTFGQSKLLESMGSAYIKEEVQKKVVKIIKANADRIFGGTGADSIPSEDVLKHYVEDVLNEIRMAKDRRPRQSKDFKTEIGS